jgi:hypothetical protein
MTDVKPPPPSLEDISAGLLNGAMVMLLGCTIASFLGWQIVSQFTGRLPDLTAMAINEPRALARNSVIALPLLFMTFWIIRGGVRLIRENLALLRARRD